MRFLGDFLNFSGLILMAELRATLGKSSLLCTKLLSFRQSLHLHSRRPGGCGVALLNLFGTQNTPGNPYRLKTEIIQLA